MENPFFWRKLHSASLLSSGEIGFLATKQKRRNSKSKQAMTYLKSPFSSPSFEWLNWDPSGDLPSSFSESVIQKKENTWKSSARRWSHRAPVSLMWYPSMDFRKKDQLGQLWARYKKVSFYFKHHYNGTWFQVFFKIWQLHFLVTLSVNQIWYSLHSL